MNEKIIDGKDIINIDSFYDIIQEKLKFPEYFGRNLDALWELIADEEIDLPVELKLVNAAKFHENVGAEFYNKILLIFKEAQAELGVNKFKYNIE